jgi:putative endonuclease
MRGGWVYIMTNRPNGTLYVGLRAILPGALGSIGKGSPTGSQRNMACKRLVYAEWYADILAAKQREMNIKHWRRAWKVALILRDNPKWDDLYDRL